MALAGLRRWCIISDNKQRASTMLRKLSTLLSIPTLSDTAGVLGASHTLSRGFCINLRAFN